MGDGPKGRPCRREVITRELENEVHVLEILTDVSTGQEFYRAQAPVIVYQPTRQGIPFDIQAESREEAIQKWPEETQRKKREFYARQQQEPPQGPRSQGPSPGRQSPANEEADDPQNSAEQGRMIDLSDYQEDE